MADSLVVIPVAVLMARPEVGDWLGDLVDAVEPEQLDRSRLPTVEELRQVLDELGYPFEETTSHGRWRADARQQADGTWPPFSELSLAEDSLGFRLGPDEGAFAIVRRAARTCGPFIAVSGSCGLPALIDADTTDDQIRADLFESG